ncbi:MAG: iron-sulfur cluster assembly accessory protein [Leptolyngbya sp. RL_3_1]|nr:iron-sulfur cluster assembly accessory protein [Leptolyngbya sp. RL_3_1]
MIHLSSAAVEELKRLQSHAAPEPPTVRLVVTAGGCAGLRYDLGFAPTLTPSDRTLSVAGLTVMVSPETLAQCEGLTVDYAEDLMGGNFRFTNPLAQQTCSCGGSFSLEAKASAWPQDCTTGQVGQ